MHRVFRPISILAGCAIMLMVTACNGIFDDIYDEASASSGVTTEGQLLVNAASWKDWYYVDFDSLQMYIERKDTAGLLKAQTNFTHYAIPTSLSSGSGDGKTGMYTYWFDVFGKGISVMRSVVLLLLIRNLNHSRGALPFIVTMLGRTVGPYLKRNTPL